MVVKNGQISIESGLFPSEGNLSGGGQRVVPSKVHGRVWGSRTDGIASDFGLRAFANAVDCADLEPNRLALVNAVWSSFQNSERHSTLSTLDEDLVVFTVAVNQIQTVGFYLILSDHDPVGLDNVSIVCERVLSRRAPLEDYLRATVDSLQIERCIWLDRRANRDLLRLLTVPNCVSCFYVESIGLAGCDSLQGSAGERLTCVRITNHDEGADSLVIGNSVVNDWAASVSGALFPSEADDLSSAQNIVSEQLNGGVRNRSCQNEEGVR